MCVCVCMCVCVYACVYVCMYVCVFVYIYIYIYFQRGYAPFRRAWAVGFGTWEGAFWSHVGVFWCPSWGCGGLSWRFWSLFGVYVGSCRAQMGVWEAQRPQGRGLERLGLAQGWLGTRIWSQHGPNLIQVGAN